MVAHIHTLAFQGVDVIGVDVQVHIASGLPAFTVVGLPDKAVGESRERVRAALNSLGLSLPPKRITVNLSPADLAKEGSHYDLAIALGLLVAMEIVSPDDVAGFVVAGELLLDGGIRPVSGILPAAIHASSQGWGMICPEANGKEAVWAGDIPILAPRNLLALVNHFKGTQLLSPPQKQVANENIRQHIPDLRDIKGQESAKRALEIAAAGGHNMLMVGPPGSGKSMLAARLPGLIPAMDSEELLDASMIASIAGQLHEAGVRRVRPFRDPHHSCSMAAMVGGGKNARPGEVTLAHRGVLFLDELPEFNRNVLDSLRQPTETGNVTVSRANAHITYPARFQLVAAMNPCRCGYFGEMERSCGKAPKCASDYQSKISGPLFDRIDIHIAVPAVPVWDLDKLEPTEGTAEVAARVEKAYEIQRKRYQGTRVKKNAEADGELLLEVAKLEQDAKELLHQAVAKMGLSMRGYNRILRVARTIADMEVIENVRKNHIAEALNYRKAV